MTNPLSSKPLKAVSVPSGSSPDWVAVELVKEFDDNSGPPSGARFGIRGLFIVTAVFSFQFALVSYLGGWVGVMLSPLIALCMIGVAAIGEIVWGRRGGHQIAPRRVSRHAGCAPWRIHGFHGGAGRQRGLAGWCDGTGGGRSCPGSA